MSNLEPMSDVLLRNEGAEAIRLSWLASQERKAAQPVAPVTNNDFLSDLVSQRKAELDAAAAVAEAQRLQVERIKHKTAYELLRKAFQPLLDRARGVLTAGKLIFQFSGAEYALELTEGYFVLTGNGVRKQLPGGAGMNQLVEVLAKLP